jgi:hypothetical protein
LIQPEAQQRLSWNSYLFPSGQDLRANAPGCSHGRAYRCAFTASHNGANQCSDSRPAAHHDCRLLVRTYALSALLL